MWEKAGDKKAVINEKGEEQMNSFDFNYTSFGVTPKLNKYLLQSNTRSYIIN